MWGYLIFSFVGGCTGMFTSSYSGHFAYFSLCVLKKSLRRCVFSQFSKGNNNKQKIKKKNNIIYAFYNDIMYRENTEHNKGLSVSLNFISFTTIDNYC